MYPSGIIGYVLVFFLTLIFGPLGLMLVSIEVGVSMSMSYLVIAYYGEQFSFYVLLYANVALAIIAMIWMKMRETEKSMKMYGKKKSDR